MNNRAWTGNPKVARRCILACFLYAFVSVAGAVDSDDASEGGLEGGGHKEERVAPPDFGLIAGPPATSAPSVVEFNGYRSVQVNVNAAGLNVQGDAANEPSITIDPNNPLRMAIGWRQFDTIANDFRQAGIAYSQNGGLSWRARPPIESGTFRSDPVLGSDLEGNFYYYSLSTVRSAELFKSVDGGAIWGTPVVGTGGDKAWMAIDRTSGMGQGNIYVIWNVQFTCCSAKEFARFVDGGSRYDHIIGLPTPSMKWGTLDVGPDGTVYAIGATLSASMHLFSKSTNAKDRSVTPTFSTPRTVFLGGGTIGGRNPGPNPGGLLGQVWVASDHSNGPTRGNIYVLATIDPPLNDPADIMFVRSTDGGDNWSLPVRVNDDSNLTNAFQWFGTMSVAPNGRIDAVWYDTRDHIPAVDTSAMFYSWSMDAGETWSPNEQLTPPFNSLAGHPVQQKIGDYIDMVSDNSGVGIAYSATFNVGIGHEQDVYFLRIGNRDCNGNNIPDSEDLLNQTSEDCDENDVPDECDCDCNYSGQPDLCDILDGSSPDCNDNQIPDICDPNFDNDAFIDDCDADRDGDGVGNSLDLCPLTPLGAAVDSFGRPVGGNGDCVVRLSTFSRFPSCMFGPHPDWTFQSGHPCLRQYEYPIENGVGDFRIDLRDYADYQQIFGVVGTSVGPNLCP